MGYFLNKPIELNPEKYQQLKFICEDLGWSISKKSQWVLVYCADVKVHWKVRFSIEDANKIQLSVLVKLISLKEDMTHVD